MLSHRGCSHCSAMGGSLGAPSDSSAIICLRTCRASEFANLNVKRRSSRISSNESLKETKIHRTALLGFHLGCGTLRYYVEWVSLRGWGPRIRTKTFRLRLPLKGRFCDGSHLKKMLQLIMWVMCILTSCFPVRPVLLKPGPQVNHCKSSGFNSKL